jgi:hypothetical protein
MWVVDLILYEFPLQCRKARGYSYLQVIRLRIILYSEENGTQVILK